MISCPCGSGLLFADCCRPYLHGDKHAQTALALMRSRYTAYVKKNYPYLLATWHPSQRPALETLHTPPDHCWTGLAIDSVSGGHADDAEGRVTFTAVYRVGGRAETLHEESRFVRHEGLWVYLEGTLFEPKTDKVGRNTPCPCGSGKKYKKCCL